MNKQFGVPLPSSSSSYGISSYKKPVTGTTKNMSYAPVTSSNQNMSYAPKPGQNMSYANPSSTNPAPTVIKPPVEKPKLPPAADDFINNQTKDIYDKNTGARTEYGISISFCANPEAFVTSK